MIVISAYDDVISLKDLLNSLSQTINLDEDVLVVSTDSSQTNLLTYLKDVCDQKIFPFNLIWDVTPYRGYDSGAYIFAFKKYISEYYIFLHDSLIIKSPEWLNVFKSHREIGTVNAWVIFNGPSWDSVDQKEWVINKFSIPFIEPTYGIFGPMFQISREDLKKIDEKWNLERFIPFNKVIGQQGMERGWPYLLYNTGLNLNTLDGEFGHFENKIYFEKKFKNRK